MNPQILINNILNDKITMVTEERFNMILNHKNKIENLSGDIVECGVWAGGMSIFLSKIFQQKNIWVCDSFEGFEDQKDSNFLFKDERHGKGGYAYSLEETKNNFTKYDALDQNRVFFLKGFVRETLTPERCPIQKISLLRIDVDAYSATLDVLYFLYDKVVSGGYIIFDDSCLHESHAAMKHFFKEKNIDFNIYDADENELNIFKEHISLPCGCYIIKK